MYDTVEIPLTPQASFSAQVAPIKSEVEQHVHERLKSEIPFRSNLYYEEVVDLRKVADIDAILHLNAKKTGTHKIQIVEAGRKCSGQIADTIAQIVNEHPESLGVSRVDSCADIADGPAVCWIAQSVRARCAQWQAEFGLAEIRDEKDRKIPWSEMGKREVQTMYIGKRPNCFRVYDKLAERRSAWRWEKRKHERLASELVGDKVVEDSAFERIWRRDKDFSRSLAKRLVESGRHLMPFPDFDMWFAEQCVGPMTHLVRMEVEQMKLPGQEEPEQLRLIPQLPKVLTRVERQMAAGRVPDALATFEKLFSQAALEFNPFDRLEFSSFNAKSQIDMSDYSPVEFAAGMQFKHWLENGMSYQQLYAFWNTRRNGKRMAKRFAPFVAAANPPKEASITSAELYERYRSSVSRQMAA